MLEYDRPVLNATGSLYMCYINYESSLSGWDLGIVPPDKRIRTVFLPGKSKCAVCGRGITDRDWRLYQTCDFWKCRAQHRRQQRTSREETDERERRQREEFERRVRLLRDNAAGLLGIDNPERFVSAVVPAIQRPVTCLSQERLSALDDHLKSLIAEAHEKWKASARQPSGRRGTGVCARCELQTPSHRSGGLRNVPGELLY